VGDHHLKFSVKIMPKPEALDPQGRAVLNSLSKMGFKATDVRVGKVVEVVIEGVNQEHGLQIVKEMSEKLFSNPLIETFEVIEL
jgi:phosphoribosylformylglycinamidine synthase PurS subunit